METYLDTFEKHVPFMQVVVDEYMAQVEYKHAGGPNPNARHESGSDDSGADDDEDEGVLDAAALVKLHKQHLADVDVIESSFPSSIDVGLFVVKCDKVRDMLVDKHCEIAGRVKVDGRWVQCENCHKWRHWVCGMYATRSLPL